MHFATVWESIADAIPDRPAITHADTTRTWAEYDDRGARFAQALTAAGLGPDAKVGLYMYNCNEYMEAHYGVFKMRGVAINVNYRYLDEELWYLLDNSDAEAIVFHSSLADRVAKVVDRLPDLKLLVVVDDGPGPDGTTGTVPGAQDFEAVISGHEPMERITRSEDDLYMLYTGGTTGMPKGVMYAVGGLTSGFIVSGYPIIGLEPPSDATQVAELVRGAVEDGRQMVSIPCAPLMHGTGCWLGWFIPMCAGAHIVTVTSRSLDAHEVLRTIEDKRATTVTIVGDSFAKPLLRAIDEGKADGSRYDLSSAGLWMSSGVMWTTEVKQQMLDRIEHAVLLDVMGSSEGSMGTQITMKGMATETAKFTQSPETKVFTDDDREVEPGSDEVGMVAAGGNVPLGYYKDPDKSARTFRVINGERYSFPGDFAQVAADGIADPARPRQPGDQHRRGEGLPRGGRRSRQARRRRPRLPGRRHRRREVRTGGHCGRVIGRWRLGRRGRPSSPRSKRTSPATRRRSPSCSSRTFRAPPTAKPTTRPPSNSPRSDRPGQPTPK